MNSMRVMGLCAAASACGSPSSSSIPVVPSTWTVAPTRCTGGKLEAEPPQPHNPYPAEFVWLDRKMLVVFVGARDFRATAPDGTTFGALDTDPRSVGFLVLDVANKTVVRAFRGAGAYTAVLRAGSRSELLFAQGGYGDQGSRDRLGRLDVATGCLHASPWLGDMSIDVDRPTDGFIVAPDGNVSRRYEKLERYDGATLQRTAALAVDRFDSFAIDPTTRLLVTISQGDDTIRLRDLVTLAERGAKTMDVHVRAYSGWWVRPQHGQIALRYETHCTSTTPLTSMHVHCREGPRREGIVVVDLETLREVTRLQTTQPFDPAVWTPDGAVLRGSCSFAKTLCEWTPETGADRPAARPVVANREEMTFSPDGDTYAMAGPDGTTIEVRSLSNDLLLWQLALPRDTSDQRYRPSARHGPSRSATELERRRAPPTRART